MQVDYLGPTGRLIKGHVTDCNKTNLERALQRYDKLLYIRWNPKKRDGHGVWEIRRKSEKKLLISHGEFQGHEWHTLEYVEHPMINHVLDVPVLHYGILQRIKEMDAWQYDNYGKHLDEKVAAEHKRIKDAQRENIRLAIKDDKKYMQDYYEYVRSGYNPLWFFSNGSTKK